MNAAAIKCYGKNGYEETFRVRQVDVSNGNGAL